MALLCANGTSAASPPDDPANVAAWATSVEKPAEEWRIAQDSDGPKPTQAQFELGLAITERLLSPDTPAGWRDDGLPYQLHSGVVDAFGSMTEGYTVVIGRETPESDVAERILKGLPAESAQSLRIVRSGATTEAFADAWRAVRTSSWLAAQVGSFSFGIDGESQSLSVEVGKQLAAFDLERLVGLSPLIHVRAMGSSVLRSTGGRQSDFSNHWGGASIRRVGSLVSCSSGFSVFGWATGTTYSVTAGHCGYNGSEFKSGINVFGTMAGRQTYPDKDMARLAGDPSYDPYLYTDGTDNFDTRQATSAADGAIGDYVCQSGAASGSICTIKIAGLNQTLCTFNEVLLVTECTDHLGLGVRDAGYIGMGGDSGGPVYFRQTSTNRAGIRGIVIGTNGNGDGGPDADHIWWHRYADIANSMQVSAVLTG